MIEGRQGIRYRKGYKYQLAESYRVRTALRPARRIDTAWVSLDIDGTLTIRDSYAWDGPSGPTIDTRSFLRGSLVHDCAYQLIRAGLLPAAARLTADSELRRICIEDGMTRARAWYVYWGVRWRGMGATRPSAEPVVLSAP